MIVIVNSVVVLCLICRWIGICDCLLVWGYCYKVMLGCLVLRGFDLDWWSVDSVCMLVWFWVVVVCW